MKGNHDRVEAIAGAIALGEATDEERREYREHLTGCRSCLESLGGEHEIERVAARVASARDSEVWQPALGDIVRSRLSARARYWRYAFSVVSACAIVAFGLRIAILDGAMHHVVPAAHSTAATAAVTHLALETRPSSVQFKPAAQEPQPRRLMVVHNVVQIARAPFAAPPALAAAPKTHAGPSQIAEITVHPDTAQPHDVRKSDIPIWRRNDPSWRTVAKTTTTSVSEVSQQTFQQSAESIRLMHPQTEQVVREATPLGGETAINPQPAMIAYDEGAEGTTVFEVMIDEQGNPSKCIITQSSGYAVLDNSVCQAAMRAKYTPKTVDGRPVDGTYHDAFTFRMTEDGGVSPTQ